MTAILTAAPSAEKSTNVRVLEGLARWSPHLAARVAAELFFVTPRRRAPKPAEAAVLARGRPFRLHALGHRLQAWRWGEGEPVVLVHGWGGAAAQLTPLVEPLVAAGREVIAVDLPGHGQASGWRAHVPLMGDALAVLLDRLREPAVVAHSLGGAAAAWAASRGADVSRLALVAAPAEPGRWLRGWLGLVTSDPAARGAAREAVEAWIGARVEDLDLPPRLARLGAPLLVVHDRRDREVPFTDGERLAAHGRLHATDGLGHRRILADADVAAVITRFVQEPAPTLAERIDAELMAPWRR